MNKSRLSSVKKIGKIIGTAIGAVIVAIIVLMVFFKFVPGYGFYVVLSGSMSPTINPGDIVFTHQVGQVKPGEVITFETNNEIVTHRAVSITAGQITTKGDANKTPDPGTITQSAVRGGYLFKLPAIGYITNLTSSKSGWFLIVIVPTILIVLYIVKDILKEAFKDDKKKPAAAKNKAPAPEPKIAIEAPDKSAIAEKPILANKAAKKAAPKMKPALAPSVPEAKQSERIVLTATTESLDLTAISPSPLKANPVEIESKGSLKSAKAPAPVETLADKKPKSVSSQNKSSGTELSQDIKDLFSLQLKGALGVTATDNTRSENPASRPAVIYRPATKIAPTASQVTPKITMESVYSPSEKVLAPKLGSTIKKIFFIQK